MQIAKLNAMLTATAAGFAGVFSKAGKEVKGFAGTVAGVAGGLAAYDIGKGIAEAAYHNTVGLVESQLEAIDSAAKLSDTLGIATESLSRLQYAASYAGASNEDLASGLAKMNKNLSDTAAGDTAGASDALKTLGLDAKALLNIPADERVGKIADALNAMENPAQRGALAQDIFGKGVVKLMPLLAEGSKGLARYGEEADKLGYSFDRIDAAQVEAANDAMQKVKNVITAVGTQLAIKLAPFIETVANKLSGLATEGDGMAGAIVNGFEAVVKGIAYAADYLELAKAGFKLLQAAGTAAIAVLVTDIQGLAHGIAYVASLAGKKVDTSFIDQLADGLKQDVKSLVGEAGEAFDSFMRGDKSKAAARAFDELRKASKDAAAATAEAKQKFGAFNEAGDEAGVEKAAKKIDELRQKVEQFNLSAAGKAGADVAAAGGDTQQQAEAFGLQEQLDALEKQKKAHEDAAEAAKKYYEETRTPAEKYAAEIERINELLMNGELDADTAQRAADKAGADLKKSAAGDKSEGPKLLQVGSQEAAQFVAQIQRQQHGENEQKQMVKAQLSGNRALQEIAKNTKNGTGLKLVSFT